MYVRELGGGASIVLLLHGAPSPADDLISLGERLSQNHQVLIPDMPGYGRTPGGDLSYDAVNARIVEMLRTRNSAALHGIVGFSGGVLRALYLLLRANITATHLVSIAGLANLDDADREMFRGFAAMVRSDSGSVTTPAMIEMMGSRMLSPLLPHIKAKVHARVGELDQACPVAKSEALVRGVPGAQLEVVAGRGHALLIEDADATIAWVVSRLGSQD